MINLITTNREATALARDMMRVKFLPFDSETDCSRDGFDWKNERQILWQFAIGQHQYIVDLRYVDPQIFRTVLQSPDIKKIIQNSAFDAAWTAREHQIYIRNIGDTRLNEVMHLGMLFPYIPPQGMPTALYNSLKQYYSAALEYILPRYGFDAKLHFEPIFWHPLYYVCIKTEKQGEIVVPAEEFDKKIHGKINRAYANEGELWQLRETDITYSARDVQDLEQLYHIQVAALASREMDELRRLEEYIAEVTYKMMTRGFSIDRELWLEITSEHEAAYNNAMDTLLQCKEVENWNSPIQVCRFFGCQKLDEVKMLEAHEVPPDKEAYLEAYLTQREHYGMITKYGRKWLEKNVSDSGKVRCSYNQIINTGRYSAQEPNLQNIPNKIKRGYTLTPVRHRQAFVAAPGFKFVVADFKAQELAIIAVLSQEPLWLETIRSGGDMHEVVARIIFMGWESFDKPKKKLYRTIAKNINFGVSYGLKGAGLAEYINTYVPDVNMTEEWATELLEIFFGQFPYIKRLVDTCGQFTVNTGTSYSTPPFNRLRTTHMDPEEWRKRNIGKNNKIQATAADMSKQAMMLADKAGAILNHMNHDELVCEVPIADVDWTVQILDWSMREACFHILGEELTVPEIHVVDRWFDAKLEETIVQPKPY